MKRIITSIIVAIAVAMSSSAQNVTITELMNRLESDPSVSIAFVTSSMLKHLPKDSSPILSSIASQEGVGSIRVYSFTGGAQGESNVKALMDLYVKDSSNSELLMKSKNGAKETIMWGIPRRPLDQNYYSKILLMSRRDGAKSSLIIISGNISPKVVGDLIDSVQ